MRKILKSIKQLQELHKDSLEKINSIPKTEFLLLLMMHFSILVMLMVWKKWPYKVGVPTVSWNKRNSEFG